MKLRSNVNLCISVDSFHHIANTN